MEDRPFIEKTTFPTSELLKNALKNSYKYYQALLVQTGRFKQEWNFSKSSGWMQKISDSKKALFYLIPLQGSYRITLTVRENEKAQLMQRENLNFIHQALLTAKKYSEGYSIQFTVTNGQTAEECEKFIANLIALRYSK